MPTLPDLARRADTATANALTAYEPDLARVCGKPMNARKQVRRLRTLFAEHGWVSLDQIDTPAVSGAMAKLASSGRTVKTIETLLSQLKAFFEWAKANGHANVNPVDAIKRSARTARGPSRRRGARPLTDAEISRLIAAAETDERREKPRFSCVRSVMYRLGRLTGARKGQLERTLDTETGRAYGLRWRDVDEDAATIVFDSDDAKTGQGEILPLHQAACEALRAWRARCEAAGPDDNVFPFDLQDRVINADLEAAGIPKRGKCGRTASFHSLRKSFAYGLVRSGVDVNVARRLLQHETIEMTLKVYDEARHDDLLNGLEKMFTPDICSSVKGLRAMAGAGYAASGGNSEKAVLTGERRSDSVSHLASHTEDTSMPPGPLAFAAEQGPTRFDGPGDNAVSIKQLAAALSSREGRKIRPSEAHTIDPSMPRGGLEPPLAKEDRERWADDVAGVLEAVARLLRTGAAREPRPNS